MAVNFMVFIIYFKLAYFELILLIKSFKNSKVNAQKWKFFCKLFDAKRYVDGRKINKRGRSNKSIVDGFFLQNK